MAVASGASFTSTSANAGNIVTAGTLSTATRRPTRAILDVDASSRARRRAAPSTLTNTGDVAGVFTLSKDNVVDSDPANPLSAKLDLVVADLGHPPPGRRVGQVQRQARRHGRRRAWAR